MREGFEKRAVREKGKIHTWEFGVFGVVPCCLLCFHWDVRRRSGWVGDFDFCALGSLIQGGLWWVL